jgi:dephospho-CoA kinase
LSFTILINTPEDIRIKRVTKRDNITREEVLARIKNQLPDEEKMKMANFVIFNTDETFVIPQVLKVYNKIINK